jgi:HK97 gp10 family phage protein
MLGQRGTIRIDGELGTTAVLRELPELTKKALRASVTAGSTPILRAARAGAITASGFLKSAMARKIKAYKSGAVAAIIGARRDAVRVTQDARGERRQVPANYFHLVEGGTKPHIEYMKKTGQMIFHPGAAAHPFLRTAYEATRQQAEDAAAAKLFSIVQAEAVKLGRR